MAKMHTFYTLKNDQRESKDPTKHEVELENLKLQLNTHLLKSRMMLNRSDVRDPDQVKLSDLLERSVTVVNMDSDTVHAFTKELSEVGQKVFKKAWETLKMEVETGKINH